MQAAAGLTGMEINLIREQSITVRTEAAIQAEASSADMGLSEDAPVLRGPSRRGRGLGCGHPGSTQGGQRRELPAAFSLLGLGMYLAPLGLSFPLHQMGSGCHKGAMLMRPHCWPGGFCSGRARTQFPSPHTLGPLKDASGGLCTKNPGKTGSSSQSK